MSIIVLACLSLGAGSASAAVYTMTVPSPLPSAPTTSGVVILDFSGSARASSLATSTRNVDGRGSAALFDLAALDDSIGRGTGVETGYNKLIWVLGAPATGPPDGLTTAISAGQHETRIGLDGPFAPSLMFNGTSTDTVASGGIERRWSVDWPGLSANQGPVASASERLATGAAQATPELAHAAYSEMTDAKEGPLGTVVAVGVLVLLVLLGGITVGLRGGVADGMRRRAAMNDRRPHLRTHGRGSRLVPPTKFGAMHARQAVRFEPLGIGSWA